MGKHPAFHDGPPSSHNYLYSEYEAAARFGMPPAQYFEQSREERIYMTAFVTIENATTAMRAHDVVEKAREDAKKKK